MPRLLAAVFVIGVAFVPGALADGGSVVRDPVGDVKGGKGPDIVTASATEHAGRISFRVEFSKAPPLADSPTFSDQLAIVIWTTQRIGKKEPKALLVMTAINRRWYVELFSSADGLVPLRPAVFAKKSVTVSVPVRKLGLPKLIRFSVMATRTPTDDEDAGDVFSPSDIPAGGTQDLAPNKGASTPLGL